MLYVRKHSILSNNHVPSQSILLGEVLQRRNITVHRVELMGIQKEEHSLGRVQDCGFLSSHDL